LTPQVLFAQQNTAKIRRNSIGGRFSRVMENGNPAEE